MTLIIEGPITSADVPRLCERISALMESGGFDLRCDLGMIGSADLAAVDALARLQLIATRLGRPLRFCRASAELAALIELAGLSEVLPLGPTGPDAAAARRAGTSGRCRGRT